MPSLTSSRVMRLGHQRAEVEPAGLGEADEAGEVPQDLGAADLRAGEALAGEHRAERRQLITSSLPGMPTTTTVPAGRAMSKRLHHELGPADDLEACSRRRGRR